MINSVSIISISRMVSCDYGPCAYAMCSSSPYGSALLLYICVSLNDSNTCTPALYIVRVHSSLFSFKFYLVDSITVKMVTEFLGCRRKGLRIMRANRCLTTNTLTVYGSRSKIGYVSTWKLIWSHCLRNRNEYKCVFVCLFCFCFCSLSFSRSPFSQHISSRFFPFHALSFDFHVTAHHIVPPRLIMFCGHKNT